MCTRAHHAAPPSSSRQASGATAKVDFGSATGASPVFNDPALLTRAMTPTITRVSGGKINPNAVWMPSGDYALYQEKFRDSSCSSASTSSANVKADDAAANLTLAELLRERGRASGRRRRRWPGTRRLTTSPAERNLELARAGRRRDRDRQRLPQRQAKNLELNSPPRS